MTLLAFHVWDDTGTDAEEEAHQIVFAETAGKAKYLSEAYYMNGDYTEIKAKRAPEFDQYADQQKVPKEVMLQHGWRYECEICFAYTDEDGVVINDDVYCEECQEKIYIDKEDGKVYMKE